MLIMTGRWQWADPLSTEPSTFKIYMYINCVTHRFHFLPLQFVTCFHQLLFPLAPYILSSLTKPASPTPWLAFTGPQPSVLDAPQPNGNPCLILLTCWFHRPCIRYLSAKSKQTRGVVKWEPQAGPLAAQTHTCGYSPALTRWNQQQEQPRSMKAERGSRDSWFPMWILTSATTAALREPFFSFVSLPLLRKERKIKICHKKYRPKD